MSDMIERAAKAIGDEQSRRAGILPQDIEPSERLQAITRAALIAAFDPEDEALVEVAARALCVANGSDPELTDYKGRKLWTDCDWPEDARVVIAALKAAAQGGRP